MAEDASSKKFLDSDKPKGKNVVGPSVVNMVEHNNSIRKPGHLKKDYKGRKVGNKANGSVNGSSNSLKAFISTSKLNDSIIWHARLGHVHFKRMQDMFKDGLILAFDTDNENDLFDLNATPSLGNKKYFVTFIDDASRDAIFDENIFSSIPKLSQRSLINGTGYINGSVSPEEVTEEDDPNTFDEAMKSQDVAFYKKAINDEIDSIMGNNTWVLADIPPGCKSLGCKWIFKKKMKVDGTVETFKASGTYQYHKTTDCFGINLQSDYSSDGCEDSILEWHLSNGQKFDEVVFSSDYLLNQDDKCVYSKFDESGKGVIICLYVDDMVIFGTNQVQVDLAKEFLSSRFSMKDMGVANVILRIRIKHESNDSQMHNNIMAIGSRDRPPMLAMGRYAQWQSRFMRYIYTRPNGEALKKCILQGPYKLSHIIIPGQPGTDESLKVPKCTAVETLSNITPKNKAHYDAEKEAIHLLLTGIGDEIYSTVYACKTAHDMWIAIERIQQERSRFVTIVKQVVDLDTESYQKLFDILKQYQKEVNEIRAEKIAKTVNPLALVVAAQ
ncbi:zinc finger, CCHC-type containing protein [Tanacetum coccineum]|uniref:Zinc finger, CCHC-type containing protein n=1 Tax=Tanacetum coccineum TaxID=301880 RepID=A0ABQ5FUY8_9ASTR